MEDLSRRTFLRGALLAGAGAVGAGALTACAPQTTESKSAGASAAADDATVNGDYPWPVNRPRSLPRTWKKRFRPISSSSGWASPAWRPPLRRRRGRVHHRVREVREA